METSIFLNSRQKELLGTFLNEDKAISYKFLSDHFKLSVRTIQREVRLLEPILNRYNIKINKKFGSGLYLQGTDEDIQSLYTQLKRAQIMETYSPEERQEGIAYDLLLSNEPLKQNYFSTKFGVSVATVSHDLDKVSTVLEKEGMHMERLPGVGVYVEATEQQRRTLLSRLLHKDITFEDWLKLFQGSATDESMYGKLGSVVRSRLLKFIQTDKVMDVDHALRKVLQEQSDFSLSDRNYVNLMIHIILAMERIQCGKVMEYTNLNHWEPFDSDTLLLSKKIVSRLESVFSMTFPEIEIKYISLHLAGAKVARDAMKKDDTRNKEFMWIELTQGFIRSIEHYLDTSFAGDKLLFEGLVSHFVPAFNRLKYGLQIHNPMLDKIKENYPDVFIACQQACAVLAEKTGYVIPEDEVGYLTMHAGASMLRIDQYRKEVYHAVVVCASGLGTSMYLATQIHSEIPNLHIETIISVHELQEWLNKGNDVDIIISTVNLPIEKQDNVVIVSPFLKKEDLAEIQQVLVGKAQPSHISPVRHAEQEGKVPSLLSLAAYGEGMMQILRNFHIYEHVQPGDAKIASLLERMEHLAAITDLAVLIQDLLAREQQGGFILDNLAMLHTKSRGVKEPVVALFRTDEAVPWHGDNGDEQMASTIILLVVPMDAPKEQMKMISEIPASFVDEAFLQEMTNGKADEVRCLFEKTLANVFEQRITSIVKGLQG